VPIQFEDKKATSSRWNWLGGDVRNLGGLIRVRLGMPDRLRFTALLHHITIDLLKQSYVALKHNSVPGIDGVTWQSYGGNLEEKLKDLHERVHRGSYRARPAERATFRRLTARSDR
jgi:hypothetical protein